MAKYEVHECTYQFSGIRIEKSRDYFHEDFTWLLVIERAATEINFIASEVEYTEAIDGEIVQLSFDEDPDQDPFNRTKCYLLVSQNYEFPGKPTVEWHDGKTYDGGADVVNYNLSKNLFELTTTNNLKFKIQHNCKEETFIQIQKILSREFDNGK